jgi:hypothetical protein
VPALTSHGNVTKSTEKPKRDKIANPVTKGRRGRPPGSKNKKIVKPVEKQKSGESLFEEDCSLSKQIKIEPSVEPSEECTSASLEAAFSDVGIESTE